jgi:hypothetical protein
LCQERAAPAHAQPLTGSRHVLQRLLENFGSNNEDSAYAVPEAAVAGRYAALVNEQFDPHYGGSSYSIAVFDDTCYTEAIVARDATGIRTLDTAAETLGPGVGALPPRLITNLSLTGDTLSWDHAGTPESAQLH